MAILYRSGGGGINKFCIYVFHFVLLFALTYASHKQISIDHTSHTTLTGTSSIPRQIFRREHVCGEPPARGYEGG